MQKCHLIKLCFSTAWLVAAGWTFAAPAPIQRGPLMRGTAPAKAAPAPAKAVSAPAKAAPVKAAPRRSGALAASNQEATGVSLPRRDRSSGAPTHAKKPVPAKAMPPQAKKPIPVKPASAPAPIATSYGPRAPYRGAIAVDADTGRILFSDNMRTPGYPASVTKLMTFLLVLEDIQAGLYGLNDRAVASPFASLMEPSKVDIRPGQSMTIHDLLLSIMVKSANDAAEVLAEHSARAHLRRRGAPSDLSPEELCAEFVARMNLRAKELGMRDTRYASPNGLPPPRRSKRGFDVSTAADLVELGKVLVRMPKALSYTSRASCTVTDGSGKTLTLAGHNYFIPGNPDPKRLCTPLPECDGLKTGYTSASGCSIMLTAHRNGRRVIVVVLGSAGRHEREKAAGHILRDALDAISIW